MQDTIQSRDSQGRVADAPSGHWVYRALPRRQWPYAQLARWDRPIGWWLLLWPCWWSAAMAGLAGAHVPGLAFAPWPHPWHLVLFLIGAVVCCYNIWMTVRSVPLAERRESDVPAAVAVPGE